jgi:hypothetical protein
VGPADQRHCEMVGATRGRDDVGIDVRDGSAFLLEWRHLRRAGEPETLRGAIGYLTNDAFAERLERAIARSDRVKPIEAGRSPTD